MTRNYALLNSCIIEYLLDKNMNNAVFDCVEKIKCERYETAISLISYMELMEGAFINKEERLEKFLKDFDVFPIDVRTARGAGITGTLYKEDGIDPKGISVGDKLIASTSIINQCPIITANIRDFPIPFFKVIKQDHVFYKKGYLEKHICIGTLIPDYKHIGQRVKLRK